MHTTRHVEKPHIAGDEVGSKRPLPNGGTVQALNCYNINYDTNINFIYFLSQIFAITESSNDIFYIYVI